MLTTSQKIAIVVASFQGIIILIGLCLQIKTYSVLKKEKNRGWKLYISHGIVMLVTVSFGAFFETITDFVTPLSDLTGDWLCDMAFFMKCLYSTIPMHSFIIAVLKYVFIVHHHRVVRYGKDKTEETFFWVSIVLQIIHVVAFYLRPGIIELFPEYHGCYGRQMTHFTAPTSRAFSHLLFCELDDVPFEGTGHYIIYVVTQGYCFSQFVVNVIVSCNLVEPFIYYGIFSYISRYTH